MEQLQNGVIIEQGPQSWAIIQQKDGRAAVELAGRIVLAADWGTESSQVYARVVQEDTAETICHWTQALMKDDGTWSIQLEEIPAGGLYRIETSLQINGNREQEWNVRGDMIHHIGIGDLWVIAGQSNAAGYGKGPVHDPAELGIHLLRNSGKWDLATHPFNESSQTIHVQNRELANPGHSPFLAFARIVKRHTGWPIGLVQASLGGSPLRAWNPLEDGVLYRNMRTIIESVGDQIRGVLWYQGCSDCNDAESITYAARFGTMVNQLRQDLGDEALPFLTVQLNRCTALQTTDEDNRSWGMVREQQRQAAQTIPYTSIIPAIDCPLSDEIHNSPAGNLLIGERMARTALAVVYGCKQHYRAPEIKYARAVKASDQSSPIELEFDHVGGYLLSIGPAAPIVKLEDEQGSIDYPEWSISGRNTIRLVPTRPLQGQVYVHFGSERNPAAYFPLDSLTYMPPLSFYNVPVQ